MNAWKNNHLTAYPSEPWRNEGKIVWKMSLAALGTNSLLSGGQEHANVAYINHWSSLASESCNC